MITVEANTGMIVNLNVDQCKARKNQRDNVQCPHKSKSGSQFCGKHSRIGPMNLYGDVDIDRNVNINRDVNINADVSIHGVVEKGKEACENSDKVATFREFEKTQKYSEYLTLRKNYIKDSDKVISLVDFLENDKIESYSASRIAASLDFYKLNKNGVNSKKGGGSCSGVGGCMGGSGGGGCGNDTSRFIFAMQNAPKLKKHLELLLKATENIDKVIKIQRFVRGNINRYYTKLRGPALYRRELCVNEIDFYTLDPIREIGENEFFSLMDTSGHIYGFHIDSIVELILKSDENYWENFKKTMRGICYRQFIRSLFNHYNKLKIANPYTRELLCGGVKMCVIALMARSLYDKRFARNGGSSEGVFGDISGGNTVNGDYKTQMRNKCFAVFQKIDKHGYFTDFTWIFEERPNMIKAFYRKLALLWNFEFGLTETAKYKIAQIGNALFANFNEIMNFRGDKYHLLDKVIDVVNKIVGNGESEGDMQSGCIIVLYALAHINPACIRANPWLG